MKLIIEDFGLDEPGSGTSAETSAAATTAAAGTDGDGEVQA